MQWIVKLPGLSTSSLVIYSCTFLNEIFSMRGHQAFLGWSDIHMSLSVNCNCLCLDDCAATRSMNHLKLCLLGSLLALLAHDNK